MVKRSWLEGVVVVNPFMDTRRWLSDLVFLSRQLFLYQHFGNAVFGTSVGKAFPRLCIDCSVWLAGDPVVMCRCLCEFGEIPPSLLCNFVDGWLLLVCWLSKCLLPDITGYGSLTTCHGDVSGRCTPQSKCVSCDVGGYGLMTVCLEMMLVDTCRRLCAYHVISVVTAHWLHDTSIRSLDVGRWLNVSNVISAVAFHSLEVIFGFCTNGQVPHFDDHWSIVECCWARIGILHQITVNKRLSIAALLTLCPRET